MINDIGLISLMIGFGLAVFTVFAALIGAKMKKAGWISSAQKAFILITIFIFIISFPSKANAQDETPVSEEATLKITGAIINKNTEQIVQESMEVMLHAWNAHGNQAIMLHGQSLDDGTYKFSDVALDTTFSYSTMAIFENGSYYSESISLKEDDEYIDISIYVYDFTSDISNLYISGLHLLFHEKEGDLAVLELFIVENPGTETVRNAITTEDGNIATLVYPVHNNASPLEFNDEERYIETSDGFADKGAYIPSEQGTMVETSYTLEYENILMFDLKMPLDTDNVYVYIATSSGIEIENNTYPSIGTSTLRDGTEVEIFEIHGIKSGETLNLSLIGQLKGKPEPTIISNLPVKSSWISTYGIPIGGLILGITFIGTGIWWWRSNGEDELEQIISEIVHLDIRNEKGEIEEKEYNNLRDELLMKAKELEFEEIVEEKE